VPGFGADSKKKTLVAQEQDRHDVAKRRIEWRESQGLIDPASVVFIDETWAKTNMTRRYGRSEMGSRVIEGAGAELRYLPPYSPDFNPIELAFSKLKKLLRDGAARTVDKLWELCGSILDQFTELECRNFFKHCGYCST